MLHQLNAFIVVLIKLDYFILLFLFFIFNIKHSSIKYNTKINVTNGPGFSGILLGLT